MSVNQVELKAGSPELEVAPPEIQVGPRAQLDKTGWILPDTTWSMNGTWTISENEEFVLIAQNDGNLVLYQVIGKPPQKRGDSFQYKSLWATGTQGKGASVVFQTDGNYVVYSKDGVVWASNTEGTQPLELIVQNDGNLVIYKSSPSWASGTVQ